MLLLVQLIITNVIQEKKKNLRRCTLTILPQALTTNNRKFEKIVDTLSAEEVTKTYRTMPIFKSTNKPYNYGTTVFQLKYYGIIIIYPSEFLLHH